jgi:CBS domain-containing protein
MLTVRDLMRAGPLTLEPEESLRAAVDVLVESGTGGAPVVRAGELVGVVTLTDVLAFEVDIPSSSSYRHDDFDPEYDGVAESLDGSGGGEAGRWFTEPWDGEGSDLASHTCFQHSEWDALDEHSVSEVMTRRVISVSPDASIQDAARIMDRAGVHRLVVTEHGELVGVLGARDIVHAVAGGDLIPSSEG